MKKILSFILICSFLVPQVGWAYTPDEIITTVLKKMPQLNKYRNILKKELPQNYKVQGRIIKRPDARAKNTFDQQFYLVELIEVVSYGQNKVQKTSEFSPSLVYVSKDLKTITRVDRNEKGEKIKGISLKDIEAEFKQKAITEFESKKAVDSLRKVFKKEQTVTQALKNKKGLATDKEIEKYLLEIFPQLEAIRKVNDEICGVSNSIEYATKILEKPTAKKPYYVVSFKVTGKQPEALQSKMEPLKFEDHLRVPTSFDRSQVISLQHGTNDVYKGNYDKEVEFLLRQYQASKEIAAQRVKEKTQDAVQGAKDAVEKAKEKTKEAAQNTKNAAEKTKEQAQNVMQEAKDAAEKAKEKTQGAAQSTKNAAEKTKEQAQNVMQEAKDAAEKAKEKTKEAAQNTKNAAEKTKEQAQNAMQEAKNVAEKAKEHAQSAIPSIEGTVEKK